MQIILAFHVEDGMPLPEIQRMKKRIFETLSTMPGKPVPATMMLELGPRYLIIDEVEAGSKTHEA
ncbi:hypothetical protein ES703_03383 [subsurface metagenome]